MSRIAIYSPLHSTPSTLSGGGGNHDDQRPQQQQYQRSRHLQSRTTAARAGICVLCLVGLVLLGTVLVLGSVKAYFGVDWSDQINESDIVRGDEAGSPRVESALFNNATSQDERVPRILHQVWMGLKPVPEQWARLSSDCRALHDDYDYMLWSDDNSRQLIMNEYSWFLPTYDGYTHYIQRVDAIRYFVLHKYGGIYFDFDIGCRKRLDPLLVYPVTLAATVPVGVSNDVIFSAANGGFMENVITNLASFDHDYLTTYATVMFSTGPMFLSAMLSLWNRELSIGEEGERIRILPPALYGKNVAVDTAPNAFFRHYYGSSWHEGDSGFILFLGKHGMTVFKIAGLAVLVGCVYLAVANWRQRQRQGFSSVDSLDGRHSCDSIDSERGVVSDDGLDYEKGHLRSA